MLYLHYSVQQVRFELILIGSQVGIDNYAIAAFKGAAEPCLGSEPRQPTYQAGTHQSYTSHYCGIDLG
jgi:hypothetical protein